MFRRGALVLSTLMFLLTTNPGVFTPHANSWNGVAIAGTINPPNLGIMRRARNGLPVPGYFGAGVAYNTGQLRSLDNAAFVATVIVQPQGLNPSNLNLQWLFLTATNHTQGGVEFVVIYYFDQPPSIGVFDWSLQTPSWVWTFPLSDFSNNIRKITLPDGHVESAIRYENSTFSTSTGWENKVLMWNYVKSAWDVMYVRDYSGPQQDCSKTGCEFWSGIAETFPIGAPMPEINPVGFLGMQLWHDAIDSHLSPSVTTWVQQNSPWDLLDFQPNNSFVVGNYTR